MKFFQALFICGVLGLALWGLASLSAYLQRDSGESALASSLTKAAAKEEPNASTEPGAQPSASSTAAVSEPDAGTEDASKEEPAKDKADYFETNPFTPASKTGPRPKAVMPELAHNFDRMILGETGRRDFVLKNEGDAPLKVAKGPTMCKCTLSQIKQQEVPPGGEIKIGLEWKPTNGGAFSQTAVVFTNDPDNPRFTLEISGDMYSEVSIIPPTGWILGSVPVGTEREFSGYVYSSAVEDLEITELSTDSKEVVVSFEPASPDQVDIGAPEGEDNKVLKAYKISGKVLASEIAGQTNASVILRTNRTNAAETRLFVQLNRVGPLSILSKGWYAEQQMLQLGRIPSSEGVNHKMTLLIDAMDEDLKFSNIQTQLPFISLELKKENSPPGAKKQRYALFVKIAPGSALGEWTGPKRSKITFDTNHPKVPHFEIHADFEIL